MTFMIFNIGQCEFGNSFDSLEAAMREVMTNYENEPDSEDVEIVLVADENDSIIEIHHFHEAMGMWDKDEDDEYDMMGKKLNEI